MTNNFNFQSVLSLKIPANFDGVLRSANDLDTTNDLNFGPQIIPTKKKISNGMDGG